MSQAWRIDALDARAGLAFASWREADLSSPDLDRPAVFLSPPAFRPETLASRAIGLAASRGGAQLGLFVEGEELAFAALETLIEFVRRAYLAGGGGDAAGGGGTAPPRAPERGPEIGATEALEDESGAVTAVVETAVVAAKDSEALSISPGEPLASTPLQWRRVRPGAARPGDGGLAEGAAELVLELLRRYPDAAALPGWRLQWLQAAGRLGGAISRLSLWPALTAGQLGEILDAAGRTLQRQSFLPLPPLDGEAQGGRLIVVLLFGGAADGSWMGVRLHDQMEYLVWRHGVAPAWPRQAGDPLDDLAAWPVPADVGRIAGSAQADPSVLNLLSALSGAPCGLAAAPERSARRAAAILLFAAAHVIAEAPAASFTDPWTPSGDVHAEALADAAQVAMAWIRRQWPKEIFAGPIESVLHNAAALAYA